MKNVIASRLCLDSFNNYEVNNNSLDIPRSIKIEYGINAKGQFFIKRLERQLWISSLFALLSVAAFRDVNYIKFFSSARTYHAVIICSAIKRLSGFPFGMVFYAADCMILISISGKCIFYFNDNKFKNLSWYFLTPQVMVLKSLLNHARQLVGKELWFSIYNCLLDWICKLAQTSLISTGWGTSLRISYAIKDFLVVVGTEISFWNAFSFFLLKDANHWKCILCIDDIMPVILSCFAEVRDLSYVSLISIGSLKQFFCTHFQFIINTLCAQPPWCYMLARFFIVFQSHQWLMGVVWY